MLGALLTYVVKFQYGPEHDRSRAKILTGPDGRRLEFRTEEAARAKAQHLTQCATGTFGHLALQIAYWVEQLTS